MLDRSRLDPFERVHLDSGREVIRAGKVVTLSHCGKVTSASYKLATDRRDVSCRTCRKRMTAFVDHIANAEAEKGSI